jgi:hypothetical protein
MIPNDPSGAEPQRCAHALFARRATPSDVKQLTIVLGHAFYSHPAVSWIVNEHSGAGTTGYPHSSVRLQPQQAIAERPRRRQAASRDPSR